MPPFTLLVPVHTRIARVERVVRAIRANSRFRHQVLLCGDRTHYPQEVDEADKAWWEGLGTALVLGDGEGRPDRTLDLKGASFRDWFGVPPLDASPLLKEFDIDFVDCPLGAPVGLERAVGEDGRAMSLEEIDALRLRSRMPPVRCLRDLTADEFGGDAAIDYAFARACVRYDWTMILDDDMLLLPGWDEALVREMNASDATRVYAPKVYDVRGSADGGARLLRGAHPPAYRVEVPAVKGRVRFSDIEPLVAGGGVTVERCGERLEGASIPLLVHRTLWDETGGRPFVVSSERDSKPGRVVGGTEVHWDRRLGRMGIEKVVVWGARCLHTKLVVCDSATSSRSTSADG